MKDQSKTKQVLIQELASLRQRIAELEQSESERKRVEDALREKSHLNQTLLDAFPCVALLLRPQTREVIASNTAAVKVGALPGTHCFSTWGQRQDPCPWCLAPALWATGEAQHLEVEALGIFWDAYWIPVEEDLYMHFAFDITRRKQAEEQLHASLRDKDILLNEIHHRVKNNLQVISSLLKLQASACGNPELTERLNESRDRIQAMALVHEKLYNSRDFSGIDLAGYVRTLSQELFQSFNINTGKIDLTIQTDGVVRVDIIKAIPCGLILNELISNVLKHAFPGGRQGELQIIIRETKNTEIEIVVRDNGLGLPVDVDIHAPRSLGLDLVNGLVKNQLDGQIEVRRDKGTEFRIKFPL